MATRASFSAPARATGPLLLGALLLAACNFETTNPGRVLEEDLNAEQAVKPLVVGMSSDFSTAVDDISFLIARASDEMAGSGSYSSTAEFRVGKIPNDYVDWEWEAISRARWVAEDGLRRMQEIEDYEFQGNELTARAYLFAGLSNKVLGESYCRPVFDGGPAQTPDSAFRRAITHFTEAIDHAQQAGNSEIELAAYGGRAQAYVGLGDWTNAVADAGQVPTDFVYNAFYHTTSGREQNVIFEETGHREEMSPYNTYVAAPKVSAEVAAAISDDGGAMTDETADANDDIANDVVLVPATPQVDDAFYLGYDDPYEQVKINVGTAASDGEVTWEYWDGSAWTALSGVTDETNHLQNSGTNTVTFTLPYDWETRTLNLQGPFYYVRARVTSAGTSTALGTQAWIMDAQDPRTPFTYCPFGGCRATQGADGSTPHYLQLKYLDHGAEIPVVKGTEMRLIEAEALLEAGDVPGAIASINEVRDHWDLDPIDPTGMTLQEAWITLDHERLLTLWLEGRRFFDMRRWEAAGLDYLPAVQFIHGGTIVYPGEDLRAICIPVSESECLTNLNVRDDPTACR